MKTTNAMVSLIVILLVAGMILWAIHDSKTDEQKKMTDEEKEVGRIINDFIQAGGEEKKIPKNGKYRLVHLEFSRRI